MTDESAMSGSSSDLYLSGLLIHEVVAVSKNVDSCLDEANTSSNMEEHILHNLQCAGIELGNDSIIPPAEPVIDQSDYDDEEPRVVRITKEEEKDLTNKFLTGLLTFSEYAAQMGENNEEETYDADDDFDLVEDKKSINIDTEISSIHTGNFKKRGIKKRLKSRNSLPPVLKGLMGEANLRYARGDHETAIKMCLEIIRQVPKASEPFHSLAGIYEELGDHEKSLQMALIAAHLSPSDAYQWINLAVLSEERGDLKQAITCYSKAIKADMKNVDVHMKHAALLEKTGDCKLALKSYFKLLSVIEPQHGEMILQLAKMLTEKYHQEKDLAKAKGALEIAFEKCPQLVTTELVNIMLEVLIGLKDFERCIEILVVFCGLQVDTKGSNNEFVLQDCTVPDSIAVDILAKLVIVVIHLKAFHLLNLLSNILALEPDEAGDIYFDIAEALMDEGRHQDALKLLEPLVKSVNYNLPAVWLRVAECHKALDCLEESVKAYLLVVEKVPQHLGARLAVAELLNQLGRRDEALAVLTQDEESEKLSAALLHERCQLLQANPEQKEQFLAVGQLFLSRHCVHIKNREELYALTTLKSERKKVVIKENRINQKLFSQGDGDSGEFSQNVKEPTVEEEWHLFWSLCELCLELRKYDTLQRIAFSAQGSQKFSKYSQEIDLLCLSSCYYNSDAYFGYNMARALVIKNIDCERSWNIFNLMILRADDSRHNRFLMRLLARNPNHTALATLHANNCLVAGTYKYALSEYTTVFQKENSALMAFLTAATLCQMACQKFSAKKHSLVAQAIAYFWKYKELRGSDGLQESHYNIARAFHQLGLLPPAIFHYKKALEFKSEFLKNHDMYLNLQRETAFNLHLIYLSSGARDIARMYLEKYVVI